MTSPKYETIQQKKFYKFTQNREEASNNNEEIIKRQNLFMTKAEVLKENELMKPKKEGFKIDMISQEIQDFTKGKLVDDSEDDSKLGDKNLNKRKVHKKDMNIEIDDDDSTAQIITDYFNTEDVNKYEGFIKKKKQKYNMDLIDQNKEENEFGIKKKKLIFRNEENLKTTLSESFINGMPTKVKVYKCVIWRNIRPGVNEDTIKHILQRSGSQRGLAVNLDKKKPILKSSKKFEQK